MTSLPLYPALLTDLLGSVANIVFAFFALRHVIYLNRREEGHFIWNFLLHFCVALAAFSISRATGHLLKHVLLLTGHAELWRDIAPLSGGFNTLLIISVSAVTIFFHTGVRAYREVEERAASLKQAYEQLTATARELRDLNLHLEEKVEERTAELAKSERKFRHLFTNSKDMIYFCDMAQNLMDINQSGLEMLGYDPEEKPTLNLYEIFRRETDVDRYFQVMERDGFVRDMEVEFVRKDGRPIQVLLSATALYDEAGKMIGCEGIAKDLTKIKQMMEQLVASEKMASVGQMAAGVAHEINTPLGIILGYAQLMKDDFPPDSETYQNLEVIERQTKSSRKIVADLLKFSRQSGSVRENLDLNEILREVVAVTEHNLRLAGIEVRCEYGGGLPRIVGDPEKLRQVFVNLCNNALHAMEELGGGTLWIRSSHDRRRGELVVEVEDTGHGIAPEVLPSIFDPFFTTKPVGKGTGLGLSVSYGIVEDHGGRIEVVSPVRAEAEDGRLGTRFRICLPVAAEVRAVDDEGSGSAGPGTRKE